MDTRDFLSSILPEQGYYCLARPHEKGYFLHRVFDNVDDMTTVAHELDGGGHDVYFAVASLKEPCVYDPAKNNGKGGKRYRTKSNIHSLKAVFFEVDVLHPDEVDTASAQDKERKYNTQNEALSGVREFAAQIGWPLPTVVCSGWGFHFYWPLKEAVKATEYEVLIKKLKLLSKHFKFKLDMSAADISRVFRVPGTHNNKRKNARKEVVVHRYTQPSKFTELHDALDKALKNAKIAANIQQRVNLPDYLNFGKSNIHDYQEPLKLRPIMEKCAAMRECMTNPNDVSYHTWYRTLQVVRHCERGDELIHKISALSTNYSVDETDKMIRSLAEKDIPPTLCETFERDSSACAECPYRGKVRSPAAFGGERKKVANNAMLAMQAAVGKMPPPPYPFKHTKGHGVTMVMKDKAGNAYDELIFAYDLEPVKRLFSERDNREVVQWNTNNPSDGFVTVEVPSASLYDKKSFSTALADCGIYCDLHKVDYLRAYMIAYTQQIQTIYKKEFQYGRLGWRDDAPNFVLGEKLYTPKGNAQCNTEHRNRVMSSISQSGTLDSWKSILQYFEGAKFAGHQFAIGIGFGSVLMPFTGISGGIVNMTGKSGEGKSTVQKIVNSIWGHPTKLMLPAESKSSTYNAKVSFINLMNSLPICAEEITNATSEEVGSLAYAVNQGTEKWRANIKGEVRDSRGGWCTIMLSSANSSLHSKLEGEGGSTAKALRVFEYPLARVRRHTKAVFQEGVDLQLLDHFGLAGPLYIDYVVRNLEDVKAKLRETMVSIDLKYGLKPEERVWSAVLACSLTGLHIAQELGLHNFCINDIHTFLSAQLAAMRRSVDNMMPTPQEILSNYLSSNIRNMVVIDRSSIGAKETLYVVQKPFDAINIRYEMSKNQLVVARAPFRKWCVAQNHPYREIVEGLHETGMVIRRNVKRTLSAGTDFTTGQVRAMVLDASTPSFSGNLQAVNDAITTNVAAGEN